MYPSGADAGSEASVNQVPNRSEAGPSHPGPRESNSPRNSFPSVPSDLSPLPAGSVPSVPSLPSLGGDVEVEQPAPIQPQNERNEPQSPAHQDPAWIFQHDTIKHRISTVTPQRDVNDDEIDTIISLKRGIISRMAQLDPHKFWTQQKDSLVAHGILNKNAEYTSQTLMEHFTKLETEEGKKSFIYQKLLKTRENFALNGQFD